MGQGQRVGSIRVSSVDQNTARQLDGLDLDRIFEDKASGKDAKRPRLQELLARELGISRETLYQALRGSACPAP